MIERHIEHTLLKPEATTQDIIKLCQEARVHNFLGVCVNPYFVPLVKQLLAGTEVKVVTVVGFPLGCDEPEVKAEAARRAVKNGADEIDMVINVGALKGRDNAYVVEDIRRVVASAGEAPVKVIIEACLLNEEEKKRACRMIAKAGAAFVKTSTGFSKGGATLEDVSLLSGEAKKLGLRVKAAGGIRDYAAAKAMLEAGAERLGCSAGVQLVQEEEARA
jgi:deoxyribose-phosphate aldolase